MSYVDEINAFERWLETNYLPISSQMLWYKLFMLFNRCGWAEWVIVDNQRLMSLMQIKREKTFIDVRDKLIEFGLIEFQRGTKGKPSKYKLISFESKKTFKNKVNNEVNSEVNNEVNNEVNSEVNNEVNSEVNNEDIYKQKEKQNKKDTSMNEVTPEIVTSKQNVVSFVPYEKMAKILEKPAIETITVTQESNKDIDNINNIYINSSSSSLLISDSEKQKDKKTEEEETMNTTPKTYNIKAIRALSKRYCDNVKNWCGFVGAIFG